MKSSKIEKVNLYLCRFMSGGLNYSTWKNSKNYVLVYNIVSGSASGWGESTIKFNALSMALRKARRLIGQNVMDLEKAIDPGFFSEWLLYQRLVGLDRRLRQVREGLSMAMIDLAGKVAQKPYYEIMKRPRLRTAISGMAVIHVQEPHVMQEMARTWYEEGFRIFKLKLRGDAKIDAEAVDLVKKISPDVQVLIVDANYGYKSKSSAIEAGQAFAKLKVGYFQNPIRRPLFQLSKISREMGIPFTSDNTSYWPNIRRVLRHNAASLVNIHPNCMGGMDYLLKVLDCTKSYDVPCIMGGSGFVGIQDKCYQKMAFLIDSKFPSEEIGLPLYFSASRRKYYQHEFNDTSILSNDLEVRDATVFDRDELGFGISVDPSKLDRITEKRWAF